MKIIDTYNDIFNSYNDGVFDKKLWDNYAADAYKGLKETVENDYYGRLSHDYEQEILSILNNLFRNADKAEKAHDSFLKATENLGDKIYSIFLVDLDVTVILYLGLGNGAGWATNINGQKAVLIGIEKVVELGWYGESDMASLIYHELGHIYHFLFEHKNLLFTKRNKSIRQLYREGIAMVFEQTLCGDDNFFHQDIYGWLAWCKENEYIIKTEYLKRLKRKKSVQDFFGDWCSFIDHSDTGYYLGAVFIRHLMKKYTLEEICKMKLNNVYKEFCGFAELTSN